MSDIFTIGGSTVDMDAMDAIPVRFREPFGSVPTLTLQRRGIPLPGLPDPWLGKSITWAHGGTTYFVGDVVSMNPHFDDHIGWVITYQCLGFRFRLNWFPHTDPASGIDISYFNLTLEDPNYNPAQAGRSVGQVLTTVLQGLANASTCTLAGIGNYTVTGGGTIYTLPSVTATDLAALTTVPPRPVYIAGEKFGDALEAFLALWAPNHRMWIDPSGNFRFLDLRTFTNHTFVMGTDPVEPAELSRDTSNCYQRVVVRGQPIAVMALLKLSLGQLTEDFAWDGYTNAGAKAAWSPTQFHSGAWTSAGGQSLSSGTCTCTSTTTVQLTSSASGENWTSGYWDQSHQQGTLNLYASALGTSYVQCWSTRIVTCPSLSAGGTCTVTIDTVLPNTNYDHYTITGLGAGGSVVWTRYQVANSALWPRLTNQSTYPQAFVNTSGTAASLLSSPLGVVVRSDGSTFPLAFTFNAATGNIRFIAPTYIIANNAAPTDVWAYIPVYTDPLVVTYPPDSGGAAVYSGTSNTQEGLQKTLTVTIDQWRDPGQASQMLAYATDLQNSLRDTVVEGEITYYDLYTAALTFGLAASVAGQDGSATAYTTGWEGLAIPIREVEVVWPQSTGQPYITTMHVSNRKGVYDVSQFLRPARRVGYSFGTTGMANLFGGDVPTVEGIGLDPSSSTIFHTMPGTGFRTNSFMPGGGQAADPTAGTGMPDFSGQLVAGQDFGAGIQAPPHHTTAEAIDRAHRTNELKEARRALFSGDHRLDHPDQAAPGPPAGETGGGDEP